MQKNHYTEGVSYVVAGVPHGADLRVEEKVSIKMTKRIQLISRIFFMLYMLVLMYFLLFSDWYGRANASEEYRYNLVLFKEIRRYWVYRHKLGAMAVFTNLAGNVICFMPYGFVLPDLHKIFRNGFLVIFSGFVVTLGVETLQLVLRVGSFDVDDILLNTLGTVFGYLLGAVYRGVRSKRYAKKKV